MPRTLVTTQTFRPPNLLINGLFDFWQYSTSAGAGGTPGYNSCDRWMNELSGSGSINFARSTTVPNSTMRYSMQLSKGTAATATRLNQRIEADQIAPYIGKTMCFSFWIRLQSGTVSTGSFLVRNALTKDTWTADNTTEPTVWQDSTIGPQIGAAGVWKRLYSSFVVTADCVNGMSTQLQFNVGTDFVLQVAGCMLTEGTTPPADVYRANTTLAQEFIDCQRFFEKSYDLDIVPGVGANAGTYALGILSGITAGNGIGSVNFKVTKRVAPVVTLYSPVTGTADRVRYNGADIAITSNTNNGVNSSVIINNTGGTLGAAVVTASCQYTASAEL